MLSELPACFPCVNMNYCALMCFQDCLCGLYRSLGLPLGAEFSSEDVTIIYRQVFHVPSSTADASAAMQKVRDFVNILYRAPIN